jgi:leader peptidase (prepilin peptidase)/N-methyltransferase
LSNIVSNIFNPDLWRGVPFHFWSAVFFIFGSMVGSFLNVCIYRMPRDMSVIHPGSHCPNCNYHIPWFLNMPLITWVYLRGKCANCKAPISARYVLVELLTGLAFLAAWLNFGHRSIGLALVACLILAAFIVSIFIDVEHLIIPDEITIGGIFAGFILSAFVPQLQGTADRAQALKLSAIGIAIGGGLVYLILRGGKMAFGKERLEFPPDSKIVFTENSLQLPDKELAYEEIFYRKTDFIQLFGKTIELSDRCYWQASLKLTPERLQIGEETFNPEEVNHMEVVTSEIVLPREAMGFGDVKFMAAIGAFFGWEGAIFALMWSAVIGTVIVLCSVMLRRRDWGTKIPYGPYIALAAAIWLFLPPHMQQIWNEYLGVFPQLFSGHPPI